MKTKRFWSILMMLFLALGTTVSLSSCGSDDDGFTPSEVADYYLEFSVLDKGTLTPLEASVIAGQLNAKGYYVDAVSLDQAKYSFNTWLSKQVSNTPQDFDLKLLAALKTEGRIVYSKNLVYSRNGIRIE